MRLVLLSERKTDFPLVDADPQDLDSELLSEHEENELLSGLRDAGHDVRVLRNTKDLSRRPHWWRAQIDLIVARATGGTNPERVILVAAILEAHELPFLGSTPYVHGLLRNKLHTKAVVEHAGVSTPPSFLVGKRGLIGNPDIGFPAIVKPVAESSSIGIDRYQSIVPDLSSALAQSQWVISRYKQPALVERFISGVEVEVPIVTDPIPRALGVLAVTVERGIISGESIIDSKIAYDDEYGFAPIPSWLDGSQIAAAAARAAVALDIRDYGRIDMRVDESGTPWFIEANSLPHLQRLSSFFESARRHGNTYADMLDSLVRIGRARYSNQNWRSESSQGSR